LDGLIDYREFPHAYANWDQKKVAETQAAMAEILDLSHAAGKKVFYFHREVMIPPGLLEDMPDLLDENKEFDLLGERFAQLIRYKIDKVFSELPALDGIVLTLTEADFSAIHNSNIEKYPPVKVVSFIISLFAGELEKRNKRFVMRSFGSIAKDYEDILAGAEQLAGKFKFEIETKITPYDFDPFLGKNPFLRPHSAFTLSAECESVGEFMGQGNMPFEHVHNIVRYVREAQDAGVDRYVIRIDRRGNCIFDLYELNYYAYARAIENADITADEIRQEWYEKHYPVSIRKELIELDKLGWEMVQKTYFIDKQVLFHGNYSIKYLKAGFVFSLFREGVSLKNGKDIWSILTDRPAPGRCFALQEKDEAVSCADRGAALCASLGLPEEDHRHRLWRNAVVITRCVRELVRCIAAYFEEMAAGVADCPRLKAQVASSLAEYDRLAGHKVTILKREFINGLEHRLQEYRRPIEEICIEPLAAVCQALPREYAAETAARQKFLKNTIDGVVPGGLWDDHRIYRYMHGSHSVIQNDLPGRWAGNRVFPNGFFEVVLSGGKELVIAGDAAETKVLTVSINGAARECRLDADGLCQIPLADEAEIELTVRISKSGSCYPLIYAVAVR
jgi:L-rhamnose mutarotase